MTGTRISWHLRKTPDGYEGMITLPVSLAKIAQVSRAQLSPQIVQRALQAKNARLPISAKASSSSPGGALSAAAKMAMDIANNPLLQAALPPQAQAALKALDFVAKSPVGGAIKDAASAAGSALSKLKFW